MPHFPSHAEIAGPPTVYRTYPDIYGPWSRMSQELMNGESPVGRGERELLLAFAAGVMGCDYVCQAHSHVADAWGLKKGLVRELLDDFDGAEVSDEMRAILNLARNLAVTPPTVTKADVDAALALGWDEKAIHDVIAIVARAAFMHRLVAGFGFVPRARSNPEVHAQKRIEKGYFDLFDFEAPR